MTTEVTIVSELVIRVNDNEIDVFRCTHYTLIKVFNIILAIFKDKKAKSIGPYLEILMDINDIGDMEKVGEGPLRKRVLAFMKAWYSNARDMREFGDLNVNTIGGKETQDFDIKPQYDVNPVSRDRSVLIDATGGLVLQGVSDSCEIGNVEAIKARIAELQAKVDSCV
jgi:hypothetical protein